MAERIARCRPLLGTFVEVTGESDAAIEAAFGAIARVHELMSAHVPDSDISRINRCAHLEPVDVDGWTAAVLQRALHWSRQSAGAFDIVAAGAAAVESLYLPLHSGQPRPAATRWSAIEVTGNSVRLLEPACIDVGGIAKGFAADRAVAAMKAAGSAFGMVNAGGDIAGFGARPWSVQVVLPQGRRRLANVALCNGAIATSALQPDGNATHLPGIDPGLVSATVRAPDAMDADALTKIVLSRSPMAPDCLRGAGAEAFVVTAGGSVRSLGHALEAA